MVKSEDLERVAFLKKKNEARKRASALDWEKDGIFSMGGRVGYRYLTIAKMKRNLLPVFTDVGLDFKFDYNCAEQHEAIGNMSQHWVLQCTATLTDVDTGYSEVTTVYGQSGDSGDKAIAKASTYALKTWLSDTFMLIDGIDPDQGVEAPKAFTPRSDREQEEVKSKVFENAVKPPEAEEKKLRPVTPKTAKGVVPKKADDKPKEEAEDAPASEPEQTEEKSDGEKALENLKKQAKAEFKMSTPQQKIVDNIVAKWSEKAKNGELSTEEYEQFSKDRSEIYNNTTAIAFIKKYREA